MIGIALGVALLAPKLLVAVLVLYVTIGAIAIVEVFWRLL